jgi:C4-dicarboxylate transporter DctQ subunit
MSARGYRPRSRIGRVVHEIEETVIAVLLGLMTLVTFVNVVLRYGFNTSLIWGLEVTLILFAWLVLFGISYGFKVTAHLGVDAVTNLFPPAGRKALALVSALICIAYALLLLKGAWDYFAPFAALQPTNGRWFPTGFAEGVRDRAFYVTDQVPMLGIFRWLEETINYGEEYDKLPRVVPYAMLPFAAALILLRILQATAELFTGRRDSMIVSHEAEDAVDAAAAQSGDR